jgi:hypothetical protein
MEDIMKAAQTNSVYNERITEEAQDAILARAGSTTLMSFGQIEPEQPQAYVRLKQATTACDAFLGEQQLLSICAVIAHIAYSKGTSQENLLRMVEAEFSVDHIKKIPQHQFHDAMEFLIDLRMDGLRSRR